MNVRLNFRQSLSTHTPFVNAKRLLMALAACVGLTHILLAGSADAVSYTWTNASGGNWLTNGNWNTTGAPDDATDTATLGNLSGAYIVTLGSATTIGGLTMSGSDPTVTLNSTLTVSGPSNIGGGILNGTGTLAWTDGTTINWTSGTPGGTLTFLVPHEHSVTVNNTPGTFALASGQKLHLVSTGGIGGFPGDLTNSSTTFSNGFSNSGIVQLGNPSPGDNYGVNRLIVTSGTLTNNVGGNINLLPRSNSNSGAPWNTREIRSGIQNNGTITSFASDGIIGGVGKTVVNSSTGVIKTDHSLYLVNHIPKLTINGTSFVNDGAMQIGVNAVSGEGGYIAINSDTVNFNAGSTITGPGTLELASTTVNINAGSSISGLNVMSFGRLRVAPSYLSNPTTVNWGIADLTDPMTFRINGNGEVIFNRTGDWNLPANQTLEFYGPDPIGIGHATSLTMAQNMNNSGTVRMGRAAPGDNYVNAQLNLTGATTFTNNAGGLVEMLPRTAGNDTAPWFNRYINANVVNNGTINSYAGGGRLGDTGKTVINNGTITVSSSLLTSPREAQIQAFGTSFTNNGTINLNAGQLWVNTPTFNYNGGAINTTTGADILLGSSTIDANFIFNGGAEITGPVTWVMRPASQNTITRTSTWNILANQGLIWETGGGSGLDTLTVNQDISNSGLIQAGLPAPGDNFLDHRLIVNSTNSRITNNASGTILFYPRSATNLGDPWSIRRLDAELINDGQFTIFTNRAQIGKSIAGIDHVNNGTITLNNSMLTTTPQPQLDVVGASFLNGANGTINGNGILNVTPLTGTADVLENAGTLSPGLSAGILTVQGNVNFQSGGQLLIEIVGGNAVAGVDYDRLVVSGNVTNLSLGDLVIDISSLDLDMVGDVFTILTSTTNFTGMEFNSVLFTGPGFFRGDVLYGNGIIQLTNVEAFIPPAPEPGSATLLGLGMLGAACFRRRRLNCKS